MPTLSEVKRAFFTSLLIIAVALFAVALFPGAALADYYLGGECSGCTNTCAGQFCDTGGCAGTTNCDGACGCIMNTGGGCSCA